MSGIPDSIWNGGEGQELTPSNNLAIDTEAGLGLITEDGLQLVLDDTISTPTPATVWNKDDGV